MEKNYCQRMMGGVDRNEQVYSLLFILFYDFRRIL